MAMNFPYDDFLDLFFSGNSDTPATAASTTAAATTTTATTSSCDEQGYSWNDCSLHMDWDSDFRDLVESMMCEEGVMMEPHPLPPYQCDQGAMSNSASTELSVTEAVGVEEPKADESKGLKLVHLLVAAAEASTGANKTRELTRVILARLKDLVSPTDRTNMERLAAHFTNGLSKLLERATVIGNQRQCSSHQHRDVHDQADITSAFQLLQDMSPFVNFGYLTATQAILEAVEYERRVHIVDYDITEGIQWASLMQALVSRNADPSAQHLKITALSRTASGKKSVAAVQEAGRRLTAFAESIGQPFSYHHCKLDTDGVFTPSSLKLVRGEAVVINCMLHLPRFSHQTPKSLISFLTEAKALNPKLVTLVHEEVGLMGDQGFMGRFMDLLHQFSAMFDSLEAGFPITNQARGFVERVFIGPWISNWLTRIKTDADDAEAESFASWPGWLESNGFKPVEMSFANRCQAKLLLSLFSDGYTVEELGKNALVLGWKSRRLVSASFWSAREPNL